MADETISGLVAALEISEDGGTTYVKIGELKEWSIKISRNMINTGSKDSGGWERTKAGRAKWTGSAKGLYIEGDAGQNDIFDSILAGSTIRARFRPEVKVGSKQFVGDIVLSDWDLTSPEEEVHATDITFTGSGPLVKSIQAA